MNLVIYVFVLMETWLNDIIPDAAIQLDRLIVYCTDKMAAVMAAIKSLHTKGPLLLALPIPSYRKNCSFSAPMFGTARVHMATRWSKASWLRWDEFSRISTHPLQAARRV